VRSRQSRTPSFWSKECLRVSIVSSSVHCIRPLGGFGASQLNSLNDFSEAFEARPEDGGAIVNMLCDAFLNDPLMCYIYPDAANRSDRLRSFFAILHRGAVRYGAVYATAGTEAATLWRAPGHSQMSLIETLREGRQWIRATRSALPRALSVSSAADANHPAAPHWYLQVAGCEPQHQSKGYGSSAVRAGIARATSEGMPCYLETAVPDNISIYQRLGFSVSREWTIRSGMKFWGMWRPCDKR